MHTRPMVSVASVAARRLTSLFIQVTKTHYIVELSAITTDVGVAIRDRKLKSVRRASGFTAIHRVRCT